MAHYAEIDQDNKVIRVVVVANDVTYATPDGTDSANGLPVVVAGILRLYSMADHSQDDPRQNR